MTIHTPGFSSPWDFMVRMIRTLKLPLFSTTFLHVDPLLREKILLTISMANDCGG